MREKYSDLEVDRLLDMETCQLKCTMCEGLVEEDSAGIKQSNTSRTNLARFNEQMEPIFRLLRECEDMNLAPAILEPEPQAAQLAGGGHGSRPAGPRGSKPSWANDGTGGNDVSGLGIKVDIMGDNDEDAEANKPRAKEAPIWMRQSTVMPASGIQSEATSHAQTHHRESTHKKPGAAGKDDEILAELLVHESVNKKPRLDINEALGEGGDNDDSDSGSDESDFETPAPGPATKASEVTESMDIHTESEQEDDEVHEIKIGDKMVTINDVTDKMLSQMTPEEHDAYTKTLQHVYSQLY
ncbi:General transcription factor IIE subunit 1 [Desmophyllum pertusum]|uniref:General transcription factor IIE subunit 1 n=1 Tax=Desmophyllum pertusum TaxID=174260 RepID=A0A9W9Z2E4_9CNID|nr:General transcription factor IIE subunit 1 [Desmophyllum pertusum]